MTDRNLNESSNSGRPFLQNGTANPPKAKNPFKAKFLEKQKTRNIEMQSTELPPIMPRFAPQNE